MKLQSHKGYDDNHGVLICGAVPKDCVLVITGLPRSGTSAAAEVVSTFLQVGQTHWQNLEDYPLGDAIREGRLDDVRKMTADYPSRWSFKKPGMHGHAAELRELFGARLCWLVTLCDPVATAIREQMANGGDLQEWLTGSWQRLAKLCEWFDTVAEPKALVSCEKLLTHRGQVRDVIGRWILGELSCE